MVFGLKSARAGSIEAMMVVATWYYQGRGVRRDMAEHMAWLRRAADLGHVDAEYDLGISYARGDGAKLNDELAFHWLEKAAKQGHGSAQADISGRYIRNDDRKDAGIAYTYLKLSAEGGCARGQAKLGVAYLGMGGYDDTHRDDAKAHEWFEKAAAQNDPTLVNNKTFFNVFKTVRKEAARRLGLTINP